MLLYSYKYDCSFRLSRTEESLMSKNKHMTLEDRMMIQAELDKGTSFKEIGLLLAKDCTTVSKEVRKHIRKEKTGAMGKAFNDCLLSFNRSCSLHRVCSKCTSNSNRPCWSCGRCADSCISYVPYSCPRLQNPPYVCNSCKDRTRCTLEKSFYRASYAQREYDLLKSESRSGFAVSEEELAHLDRIVSTLLRNGQSLHHIAIHHQDETMISERTLYTYINNGLFSARNIDMPRTVRMRPRKGGKKAVKVDKACRVGRTFEDYQKFMAENPHLPVRQLDSVEGVKGGAVLLTVHFVQQELQLAFLRSANDSQSVLDIFEKLYFELSPDVFTELFPVLLADNGSEFSNPKAIEFDKQENQRTRLFYCDPSAPYQKGSCENNHEMIRRCIPKGVDFSRYTQAQITLMMSHINSYARPSLGNKSPYDVFAFQYGEEILKVFGLRRIPADEIILTPKVFK